MFVPLDICICSKKGILLEFLVKNVIQW